LSRGSLFNRKGSKEKIKKIALYSISVVISILILISILSVFVPEEKKALIGLATAEDSEHRSLSKTTYIINLMFCTTILVLGIVGYKKNNNSALLTIGVAFGLFGTSHFLTLLSLGDALEVPLVAIRMSAYLLVTLAMYLSI
jgi:hypothetical protein